STHAGPSMDAGQSMDAEPAGSGWVAGGGVGEWVGTLTALRPPAFGPFRALQRGAAEVAAEFGGRRVAGVVCDRPLLGGDIERIRAVGADRVLLIARTAGRQAGGLPPESLVRAVLAAGGALGNATVVAAPLRRLDPARDAEAAGRPRTG